ncbi:heat shock 70 kDa protein 12A-like [Crassostrea virginica]
MASGIEEIVPSSGMEDNISKMSIKDPTRDSKVVIAAIDFGTTYSGYAYAFRDNLNKRNTSDETTMVLSNHWQSGSDARLVSNKTPTCLLLTPAGKFDSFGFPAEIKYNNLVNDDEHRGWRFFKRFKMVLLHEKNLNKDMLIADDQNQSVEALTVFAHSIRFIKNDLQKQLTKTGYDIDDVEIQWVITIPAIWNPRSKQFMRVAAHKAGIKDEQLEFALEPEAAAVYVKETKVTKQRVSVDQHDLVPFPSGTQFMVLDLGGGTIDISVKEVLPDRTLKELHRASGNGLGGDSVNIRFFEYLETVFGENVMSKFKSDNTYKAALYDLEMEIEQKKRCLEFDSKSNIVIVIPPNLVDLFEENDKSFNEHVQSLEGIEYKKGKLHINKTIITEIFKPSVTGIVTLVRDILTQHQITNLSNIMVVGGFSRSQIIYKTVTDVFSAESINVIRPTDPDMAVLKGAVLYRYWPEVVRTRRSPFTYGSRLLRLWIEGDEVGKQIKKGHEVLCGDHFEKFVTINDEFETGQTVTVEVYPVAADTTKMTIDIYTSTKPNPRYTTDVGCEPLGRLVVDMPDTTRGLDRRAEVIMSMGSTEIVVEGKMMPDGTPTKVVFDMLNAK